MEQLHHHQLVDWTYKIWSPFRLSQLIHLSNYVELKKIMGLVTSISVAIIKKGSGDSCRTFIQAQRKNW